MLLESAGNLRTLNRRDFQIPPYRTTFGDSSRVQLWAEALNLGALDVPAKFDIKPLLPGFSRLFCLDALDCRFY